MGYPAILLTAITAWLLFDGCYYDAEEVLYPGSFCDTANVTYTGTIKPIIDANCATTGCHVSGGTGVGNFTVFSELSSRVQNGTFTAVVLEARSMPPGYDLSDCALDQLTIWVNAGGPEN